ncbi:MAG: LacI family transcriptional regulator [Verrucomicrobia bacterium]|nr:LacI family transcriptional regulator [Verrucomicrobiota bacterium]
MASESHQQKIPSYRDIAEKAGVSQMTVSLALRDHPTLPVATRRRIQKIAEEIGYKPDPNIGRMLKYIRSRRAVRATPSIAYLHAMKTDANFGPSRSRQRMLEGAKARCETLGFQIDEFWLQAEGLTPARMCAILQTRGIEGILVPPFPREITRFDFDWRDFSAISTSHSSEFLGLDLITTNRQQTINLAMEKLRARGYRRPGLIMDVERDRRTGHNILSHFLWHQSLQPKAQRVPVLFVPEVDRRALARWLGRGRPDVVLSMGDEVLTMLEELGHAVPARIGYLSLSTGSHLARPVSGIDEAPDRIGATAIDLLAAKILHFERGLPDARKLVLIDGVWREGATLRAEPR